MGDALASRTVVMRAAVLLLVIACAHGEDNEAPPPPGMQSLGSFKSPDLSEEETSSTVLPSHMHCDACRAIAYQMSVQLPKVADNPGNMYKNKKGVSKVKESAYLEAFEKICRGEEGKPDAGLGGYGVKSIGAKNVLSGPGLPASEQPGVLMGGAKWPGRLGNKCGEMLGEFGEDEIWSTFSGGGDLFQKYCTEDCTEEELAIKVKSEL